jgi:hypothetical protein
MDAEFISAILFGTFVAVIHTSASYAPFSCNMRTYISLCLHVKCPLLEHKLELSTILVNLPKVTL